MSCGFGRFEMHASWAALERAIVALRCCSLSELYEDFWEFRAVNS